MDFQYTDKVKELRKKLLGIMDEHIYPNEKKYDKQFKIVFDAIYRLMEPSEKSKRQIGFNIRPDK